MHTWHVSIPKLCSRINLLCPQTFRVFCIHRVDGTEVLLKLILGLKNHAYSSSTYPLNILLYIYNMYSTAYGQHCQLQNIQALQCVRLLPSKGQTSSKLPAGDETATSLARFLQVLDNFHTLQRTLWPRSAQHVSMECWLLRSKPVDLLIRQAST